MALFDSVATEKPFNWTCQYCGHSQVATVNNSNHNSDHFDKTPIGDKRIFSCSAAIKCLNENCNSVTFEASLIQRVYTPAGTKLGDKLIVWPLLPSASFKIFPDYIPKALIEDYEESCLVRTLSPKSSATLARRCLQGMIRDFCKISKPRLIDEIKELRKNLDAGTAPKGVSEESIEAIDSVRKIGNIGAHMEKDIDLIIEIDEGEAQVLISLIEMLFNEWYIERNKREIRLQSIKALDVSKSAAKQQTNQPTS